VELESILRVHAASVYMHGLHAHLKFCLPPFGLAVPTCSSQKFESKIAASCHTDIGFRAAAKKTRQRGLRVNLGMSRPERAKHTSLTVMRDFACIAYTAHVRYRVPRSKSSSSNGCATSPHGANHAHHTSLASNIAAGAKKYISFPSGTSKTTPFVWMTSVKIIVHTEHL